MAKQPVRTYRTTRLERLIARTLGVTDAGLVYLLKGKAAGNEVLRLKEQGLIEIDPDRARWGGYRKTAAGEDLLRRARAMGY